MRFTEEYGLGVEGVGFAGHRDGDGFAVGCGSGG